MRNDADQIRQLREIRLSALAVLSKLFNTDVGESQRAMPEYIALVDRFYEICEPYLAPQQYKKARRDVEYFFFLVDLSIRYFETEDTNIQT
jgi:hypothetical protein